jgi:hypothetical protein
VDGLGGRWVYLVQLWTIVRYVRVRRVKEIRVGLEVWPVSDRPGMKGPRLRAMLRGC